MNGKPIQCEYSKQVWQGAKDVILSTKTMMLLVNEGTGNVEAFTNASSQVAVDTKQLIVLMFNAESPVFSQQFLFEATKALKTYILNLIKASKDCVLNPQDSHLRGTLDIWCRRVGEVLKEIMVVVQPILPQPPQQPPPIPSAVSLAALPQLSNNTLTMSSTTTDTDDHDLTNSESDTSKTGLDEDNDDATGDFSDEEEELDFVVSALNVFNSLEDLRGVTQKGFTVKRFAKASQSVLSSTATLLDVSQNMSLVHSTPRLRSALEAIVPQLRHLQAGMLAQEIVMTKLEPFVCELEEAVGECVDEFRSSNNPFDPSNGSPTIPARDIMEQSREFDPPSPRRRKPISRDDSFREMADKKTVFGLPLDIILKHQKIEHPNLLVPVFFRDAVTYLRREGLEIVGLFKEKTAPERVNALISKVNAGIRLDFGGPECDVYATANLIKRFLGLLPTPLCAGKSKTVGGGTGLHEVQAIVQSMPAANQHLLCELCALLHQISLHSQFNMTPTEALATTMGPYLFFSSPELVSFPWHAHSVVCIMIERFQDVFKQYPSRCDPPMIRSASDIPQKSTPPMLPPSTFSTPQLRPRTAPSALPKKKTSYLPRLARGPARRLPTPPYKICVVGESGVGKTALIHRLLGMGSFIDYHEPTVEQRFEKTLVVDGDVYSVEVMDTSGSHIDNLAYQKWFEWSEGFIIVFDITSGKSYEHVHYWLEEIAKVRSSPHPFMLVGSHMDEELNRVIQRDPVESFVKTLNSTYVEYSARNPAPNFHKILTTIIGEIQVSRKQQLDLDKLKTAKKSSHRSSRHAKPKRNDSDSSLSLEPVLTDSNPHKGFLLKKWKEKRRKLGPLLVDNWTSRTPPSDGWFESAQEKALAELNIPSSPSSPNPTNSTTSSITVKDIGSLRLLSTDCVSQGFKLELSRESVNILNPEPPLQSVVEPIVRYYKPHFVGKEHANFVGEENDEHFIISFILSPTVSSPPNPSANYSEESEWSKVIVRTKQEDRRMLIPFTSSRKDMLKSIIKTIPSLQGVKWQEVKDPSFVESLATFEDNMGLHPKHKFGVLLCLDGQTDENEMFGNKDSTTELEQFLNIMGDKITLKGWTKFRGGLDVKNNSTGIHSYFTEHQGTEIMLHVSTMLPYQDDDLQRVERKRHIGNDIVTIIFKSGNEPFSPLTLNTKFTHVFCVVSLEHYDERGVPHYRVAIAHKPGVEPYPPFFPPNSPPVFEGGTAFREFLLSKLINGERAALKSPEFRTKMVRTRKSLLNELVDKAK